MPEPIRNERQTAFRSSGPVPIVPPKRKASTDSPDGKEKGKDEQKPAAETAASLSTEGKNDGNGIGEETHATETAPLLVEKRCDPENREEDKETTHLPEKKEYEQKKNNKENDYPVYKPTTQPITQGNTYTNGCFNRYQQYRSKREEFRKDKRRSLSHVIREVFHYVATSIAVQVFIAVTTVIPFTMLAIGAVYLYDCPAEMCIPIYLIVGGVAGIIGNVGFLLTTVGLDEVKGAIPLLLWWVLRFIWFILGNVWVYGIYEPDYEDITSDNYCNQVVYLFAFWEINCSYIILGIQTVTCVCWVFCTRGTTKDDSFEFVTRSSTVKVSRKPHEAVCV